jgi:hypothetical protein
VVLACGVIALVAGAGAAFATRALDPGPGRAAERPALAHAPLGAAAAPDVSAIPRALDELRLENAALSERLSSLEARLAELQSLRTPLASLGAAPAERPADDDPDAALRSGATIEVTPAFVASVGKALDTIQAREEAEREAKRKELQAQRIEDRVAKLQQELGLTNRQASDLRTALITQDDKREALFAGLRDGLGDPRDLRDSFRVIRDETHATLQTVLTPEQFSAYVQTEESDFFRRGPPDFTGRPPGDPTRDATRPR